MNQLQDPQIIHELYQASQAGVPILLNVRGLCCLKPRIPNLSPPSGFTAPSAVFSNTGGSSASKMREIPFFIGSADWMRRNLDKRMETITPVFDEGVKQELEKSSTFMRRTTALHGISMKTGITSGGSPISMKTNAVPRKLSSASPQNFRQRIPSPETNGFFQNRLMLSLIQDGTNPDTIQRSDLQKT